MQRTMLKFLFRGLIGICFGTVVAQAAETNRPRAYEAMLSSGKIRMAVPYDRSIYVDARGQKLGASSEISKYFGNFLTAKYKKKVQVTVVPTMPGTLLDAMDSGQADFAMGYVDGYVAKLDPARYLVYPHPRHENHVLVSGPGGREISRLEELSGETVCLGRQTDTPIFNDLNGTLQKSGKKAIHVFKDRLVLDDEDLLQMLNDGLIPYVFVASWKARLWKPLLANIRINQETESPGATTEGVIVARENRVLGEDILEFGVSPSIESALNIYRNGDFRYREHTLKNPVAPAEWARYVSMKPYFDRYGSDNSLDPLFLAALGFQETMLNQNLVSPVGAVGVMQLLPATGASMRVGNIRELEPNIHAGSKYIGSLLSSMSIDEQFPRAERALFAVAAYNAGPNNIRKARELAAQMGFNPNKWFLNVEMAAAKLIGLETFFYVRNVYKYYVTYDIRQRKMQLDEETLILETNKKINN